MFSKRIFLASSTELKEDREEFELLINRKNKEWLGRGIFLELVHWVDFLNAELHTRLRDEYNEAVRECDLFVMLFWTKVGPYTAEEFTMALQHFKATGKPLIFTYFKDVPNIASANEDDLIGLLAFKKKLKDLGHFVTIYSNIDELKLHFSQQLDKLAANGFIALKAEQDSASTHSGNNANLTGSGAIVLSIAAIRDRVVQGALKLILEPIFDADFQPGSYGYRPKRTAHQALDRVAHV